MPSKAQHLEQAQRNERFFRSLLLDSSPHLEWVVTGAFYGALHYVDAYLAAQGIHPPNHEFRDRCVARESNLQAVQNQYFSLLNQSKLARYECKRFKPDEVRDLVADDFATVCDRVLKLV